MGLSSSQRVAWDLREDYGGVDSRSEGLESKTGMPSWNSRK